MTPEELKKSFENIEIWQKAISVELDRIKEALLPSQQAALGPTDEDRKRSERTAKLLARRRKRIKYV